MQDSNKKMNKLSQQKVIISVEGTDTLANVIRRKLADQILQGEFKPGSKLSEEGLAHRFSVSRTPIREAIRQLHVVGLVETTPRKGSVVKSVSNETLGHTYETAAELEALSAFWAATRATLQDRLQLSEVCEQGANACKLFNPEMFARSNRNFHDMISKMAKNPVLENVVSNFRLKVAPFQKAQFTDLEVMNKSQLEHCEICSAINSQDATEAKRLMKKHIINASFGSLKLATNSKQS